MALSSAFVAVSPAASFLASASSSSCCFEGKPVVEIAAVRRGRTKQSGRGGAWTVRASGDMLGDMGGRDPFPAEVESNFGDKVIGFGSTEHKIQIPTLSGRSLGDKSLTPLAEGTAPLTEFEAKALLRKVVGWRLARTDAGLKLQCDWNLKDAASVGELYARVAAVADAEKYDAEIQTLENNKVRVEVWTQSIGGLSENDFIFAAKIDKIDTKDLTQRLRAWF